MGKTRAEIQKAYRQRKKSIDGATYLKKETERVKGYYKPTTEIGPQKLKIRRQMIRECMKKRRHRPEIIPTNDDRQNNNGINEGNPQNVQVEESPGPCDSTSSVPACSEKPNSLVVKLNFRKKQRVKSKALKNANMKIKKLETKLKNIAKTNDKLRKKITRASLNSATPKAPTCETDNTTINNETPKGNKTINRKRKHTDEDIPLTPNSKSKQVLRNEGLSPSKHPRLVKELTFHHSLIEDVNEKIEPTRGRAAQRTALHFVCGKLVKRYRLQSRLSSSLQLNRRQVRKSRAGVMHKKKRKVAERNQMAEQIITFLEREDNSACLPGKRDKTKCKSEVIQTRVLNDYLYNIHMKFKSENPGMRISLTTFTRYRPKYIKLVHFSSRRTCLCQKHQNMALKVKGLNAVGAVNTNNPDVMIRQHTDEVIINKIETCCAQAIKFSEWKRKEVEHRGRVTKRMQIETMEKPKGEFIELFRKDLTAFRKHTYRVKCQYEQIKLLKERLPENHVMCQMDFAENYVCSHADEVQSAYFDKGTVTLHPVVTYFKGEANTLKHTSHVYISDTSAHNSGTVYSFMKKIVTNLQHDNPNLECIHYVTDSPTSQYRNKYMTYVIAHHETLFGMKASWQYFEAGHGKGPCDGVGGTTKRLADSAVKRQTAIIQNAEDFYHWGDTQAKSQIKFVFVPKSACDEANVELSTLNTKPIKGTLELHSVVHLSHGKIATRNTSCFCADCFENGDFHPRCTGWVVHNLQPSTVNTVQQSCESTTSTTEVEVNHTIPVREVNNETYPVGTYVAALYNEDWYIGKILKYDPNDSLHYQISFMAEGSSKVCHTFKWPRHEDIIWVKQSDVLCAVHDPIPHGTRKMFKLADPDIENILSLFEK